VVSARHGELFNKVESSKIVFSPASIGEHAGKRLDGEGVGGVVVGDRDGAAIGVFVAAVAAFGTGFLEPVGFERGDELARVHASRNFQTVTRTAGDSTSRIAALGGIGFPSSRISSRMSFTASPIRSKASSLVLPQGVSAFERRTVGRKSRPTILKLIVFDNDFENVAFQGVLLGSG
jgi:hypothetical protein